MSEQEKEVAREVLFQQKDEINDRYMKILSDLFDCGEECVQAMLFTPNAQGQQVTDAILSKLGLTALYS